jgi:hypothetical protein
MDTISLVTSLLSAQAGNTQLQIATAALKSSADAEKSVVQALLGGGNPSANLGPGIGSALDVTV